MGGRRGLPGESGRMQKVKRVVGAGSQQLDELDPETLLDLTWSFIAIDLNHSGTIDAHEMSCVLAVMGGKVHA